MGDTCGKVLAKSVLVMPEGKLIQLFFIFDLLKSRLGPSGHIKPQNSILYKKIFKKNIKKYKKRFYEHYFLGIDTIQLRSIFQQCIKLTNFGPLERLKMFKEAFLEFFYNFLEFFLEFF